MNPAFAFDVDQSNSSHMIIPLEEHLEGIDGGGYQGWTAHPGTVYRVSSHLDIWGNVSGKHPDDMSQPPPLTPLNKKQQLWFLFIYL